VINYINFYWYCAMIKSLIYQILIEDLLSARYCFPVAQMVKNLPAMQETHVRSLGWENPLEKGMAIHFNILAWRIPWTEEPGELHAVQGVPKSQTGLND